MTMKKSLECAEEFRKKQQESLDEDFAKNYDFDLTAKLSQETKDAIGRVYGKVGSISRCKTSNDFGSYRFALVKEFDKEIKKLKKHNIKCLGCNQTFSDLKALNKHRKTCKKYQSRRREQKKGIK